MKIAASNVQMDSAHSALKHREVHESFRSWGGNRPAANNPQNNGGNAGRVQISSAARELAAADGGSQASEIDGDIREQVAKDPKTQLIRSMVEFFLGHEVEVFDSSELQSKMQSTRSQQASVQATLERSQAGFEYTRRETYHEVEATQFAAEGVVRTTDGREISFKLELTMQREFYQESSQSLRVGQEPRRKDPLVLNFNGNAAQLTDQRFAFDLNGDGGPENINFVASGSGFLVFDRNNDGKVNDGKELFGPQTDNGFAELAKLDDDGNGWIDESDSAFGQLRIWSLDQNGEKQLQTLAAAGVGAIHLGQVDTPFEIKDAGNQLQGAVRSTGIFLQENGNTGTIQQIDLTA